MGNEYVWRKGRPRAEVLRRFWRTSIFITCLICGSKHGVRSARMAMSSWCDSRTTSWLDSEKTRLLEFGPFAINNRQRRGEGKPETFNFLGFTHICVKKRSNGMYTVLRQTIRKRLQTKLNEVKAELQRRMHEPIPEMGKWLQAVVRGHIRYYGVPMNKPALYLFRFQVGRLWHRALSRRSHKGRVLWDRMRRLITRWLPPPTVCHPYPLRRMGVLT